MKKLSLLLAACIMMACPQANGKSSSYVFTGKDMYESCRHAIRGLDRSGEFDKHRFGLCAGYIAGIVDMHTVMTTVELLPDDIFCLPEGITTAQAIRDVTRYLADNPGKQQDLAAYLVIRALRDTYPCLEEKSGK